MQLTTMRTAFLTCLAALLTGCFQQAAAMPQFVLPSVADSADSPRPAVIRSVYHVSDPSQLFSGVRQASAGGDAPEGTGRRGIASLDAVPPRPVSQATGAGSDVALASDQPSEFLPPGDSGAILPLVVPTDDSFSGPAVSPHVSDIVSSEDCVPLTPPGADMFSIMDDEESGQQKNLRNYARRRYTVYRDNRNGLNWLPAGGEHFGWLDWQTDPYLDEDSNFGMTGAINIHWLSGPGSSPLPPRLYDFMIGFQRRQTLSDQFSYDVAASIGVWSDFEDSARDGVRFPAHAVGMLHLNRNTDMVFGVDYLDRDDITILPVFGWSLRDRFSSRLRLDLIFPRPRIDYVLNEEYQLYVTGRLTGGTWDIEFPDETNQVMTYRDYRIVLGLEHADPTGSLSALELGYVTGRHLQFRGTRPDAAFDDAFVIQWVTRL